MACVDKDAFVASVVAEFWQRFQAEFPRAKSAAMKAAFDGKTVATAEDSWWRDEAKTDRNGASVTLKSRCDGNNVTFELVTS